MIQWIRWSVIGLLVMVVCTIAYLGPKSRQQVAQTPPNSQHPETTASQTSPSPQSKSANNRQPATYTANFKTDRPETLEEKLTANYNPAVDRWDTEVLTAAAKKQIKIISKMIEDPDLIDLEHTSPLVTDDFACQALRPADMTEVYSDGVFVLQRPVHQVPTDGNDPDEQSSGANSLIIGLRELTKAFDQTTGIRAHLKIFKINQTDTHFTTRIHFEASSQSDRRGVQVNGQWLANWTNPNDHADGLPRLLSLTTDLKEYEEITIHTKQGKLFVDCTESAIGRTPYHEQQVGRGVSDWAWQISVIENIFHTAYQGMAIGDVNGDHLEDLYICDVGGLPNRLYLQNPDGSLRDISVEAGVDFIDYTPAALLIDLDNDGDQDLALSMWPQIVLLENDGQARFTPRSYHDAVSHAASLAAADYDEDGDLDLYVMGYFSSDDTRQTPAPLPFQDANNGGTNALLRNEGDFQFTDVTAAVGMDQNNTRYTFAAAWEDYDNDGDLDLYVANDFGRNNLYRNNGKRFVDIAPQAGVEDIGTGMSVTWGDYDRNGWMDLYVSNMFSGAGNRITFQRKFEQGMAATTAADIQRVSRGNTLFKNAGDGSFFDASVSANVTMGRWAWASKFIDLTNNGWQDLVVTNGFVTHEDTGDL